LNERFRNEREKSNFAKKITKMRKLASVQKIKFLESIEGADAIEKGTVLGWQLVVKKGEFQVGDLCVYLEIDSLLPDKPEFEFLKSRGMRIKTIKLRGQVSQGICFPLTILPKDMKPEEGLDVTEIIGVKKYEPPIPASLAGTVKGKMPGFMSKTDEPRVQIYQEVLDQYIGTKCYIAEKLDGSSVTYYINNGEFGVCSRNLELLETDENTLWKVARVLKIEEKLRSLNGNFALQGELVGEAIQKNTLKLRGQTAYFFNFFDIDQHRYFDFEEFQSTLEKLELPSVPILERDFSLHNDINQWVEFSEAKSAINPDGWREGIVIRPLKEIRDTSGRVSFKAVNPKFLLKYDRCLEMDY
jgi:RNA ligase (TIGR02306 family)